MAYSANINTTAIIERIGSCTDSIVANPNDFTSLTIRGVLKDMIKWYDLALEDFNALIEMQPDIADHYFLRAYTYCNTGQYNLALRDLQTALNTEHVSSIQGIQSGNNIPQLICYLSTQRSRVLHQLEHKLKEKKFREKYSFRFDFSPT